MDNVYGEIEYVNDKDQPVHSDLRGNIRNDEFRALLHMCLDEWLNLSDCTGGFYIKPIYSAELTLETSHD